MAAVTHRAFRELVHEIGGCDEYFSEMISAKALLNGGHLVKYYLDPGPVPERLVYQLMGSEAEPIAQAAAELDKRECAGIDINMGCSAPAIARGGGGVQWMGNPDAAVEMVSRVRDSVKDHRLSVKLRLGFDEDGRELLPLCRRLQSAGVEMLTLHPRTAAQKFKRSARWSFVDQLSREMSIPVVGNGDVSDADQLVAKSGGPWSGVMVGRAAVQQPWIFAQTRGLSSGIDLQEVALRFLELVRRHVPTEFWKNRVHRFFEYFSGNLVWGHAFISAVHRESDVHAIGTLVREYFRNHPGEQRREWTHGHTH
ncbi:MAG: tRNA dihydrouridine synthase [Spirochaeta sp.]